MLSPLAFRRLNILWCGRKDSVAGGLTEAQRRRRKSLPQEAGKPARVRLAIATSESMTGTSTSTPTTVASAAPLPSPNNPIATATASSKKLDVPISAQGAATACGTFHALAAA